VASPAEPNLMRTSGTRAGTREQQHSRAGDVPPVDLTNPTTVASPAMRGDDLQRRS
jgi:hypothetical protein